jgi:transposase
MGSWNETRQTILTARQSALFTQYISKGTTSKRDLFRVRLLLYGAQNKTNLEISIILKSHSKTICLWRNRWAEKQLHFENFEKGPDGNGVTDKELLREMLLALRDHPRPGKPIIISEEQKEQLVALACQKPSDHNLPQTHWTYELLAETAIEMGLVSSISAHYVSEILKKKTATS